MMNRKTYLILAAGLILLLGAGTLALFPLSIGAKNAGKTVYLCPMHPDVQSSQPGICPECGMDLVSVKSPTGAAGALKVSDLYTCPDHFDFVQDGPGVHSADGRQLVALTSMPYVVLKDKDFKTETKATSHDHSSSKPAIKSESAHKEAMSPETGSDLYTCGMHPNVIQEGPGICPICNMQLVPLKKSGSSAPAGERRIAYWVAPMDPNFISDKPGKSPMGMDLVPVYEDELQGGIIAIDPATLQSIGVVTEVVQRRDLSYQLRANGTIMAAEEAEYKVNTKFGGWIDKLWVARSGEYVRKGQPLLEIYSPDLVSAQQEYLLALNGSRTLSRHNLPEVRGGVGDLLAAARRRLELWDISPEQIETLARTGAIKRTLTIVSPTDGVVMEKMAVEGAAVMMGMDLFHIADLDTVWALVQVYEYELPWLKEGLGAVIESPYDPGYRYAGRVDFIYPYLDASTRTVKVRVVVPNPRGRLKPEMYITAHIEASPRPAALAVPKSAVIRSGRRDIVFVAVGRGRFTSREVHIGLETEEWFEITDGLGEGMEVVTSAQFLLDSEARLQEAIQRRLKAMTGGHQHK